MGILRFVLKGFWGTMNSKTRIFSIGRSLTGEDEDDKKSRHYVANGYASGNSDVIVSAGHELLLVGVGTGFGHVWHFYVYAFCI
jgi:hypothetical protein